MNNNELSGREAEIRNLRIAKISRLKEVGMEAYPNPSTTRPDITLLEISENFSDAKNINKEHKIVGRILVKRGAGKISFAKISDGTGEFQVVLQADILGSEKMKIFDKLFDMGDFANFTGTLFTTEKGENSLLVSDFKMAGKTLLPLPEKFHGLQDIEEKYRKRYLDILSDKSSFERFKTRTKIISEIRNFLDAENFLEVETPILQNQASGAMAETFNSHHNDYDLDMVLRISLEAEHKIIMAGGYPAVYEIGKNFRNEGSDSTHMQEFTMIEWYKAFEGLDYNMDLTEKMLKNIAEKVIGKTIFKIESASGEEIEVDFGKKWERLKFNDLIKEYAKIDPEKATREELERKAVEFGENKENIKKMSVGNILDFIWKKSARRKIVGPTWITHYPASLKPLAIQNENGTSETAQPVVAGFELSNHYAELVNPIKQRELLENQVKARKDGDAEAMEMNNEFLTAMEHGMPPMTGTGIGIDRLVGIFTEQNNLRDTVFFPIMKPEKKKLKKETKISVILLNKESNLEKWQELNSVAHLTAAFGAREGTEIFHKDNFETKDGEEIKLNTEHAIIIKVASSDLEIKEIIQNAKKEDLKISEFTREMINTSNDKKIIDDAKITNYEDIEHLGVLVFGEKKKVDELMKNFELI